MKALDLFAGTGWGVACGWLGIEELGVEIMPAAIETRAANGMPTPWFDVWETLRPEAEIPAYDILIGSPPCQTFSRAGKGAGRDALDEVLYALNSGIWDDPDELRAFGVKHDERTALVLTPMAQILRDEPSVVILEQVPPVLPVWEAYAELLTGMGYSVTTGLLHSEQYGVPQTRQRAILLARRDGKPALLPMPTHSRYYQRTPERTDPGTLPWVSMAEALGWDEEELVGFPRLADDKGASMRLGDLEVRARDLREASLPAQHVTSKARSWSRHRPDEPPPWADRINDQSGGEFDIDWPLKRPATTVAGRDLIGNPGANANRENGRVKSRNDGIRVTPEEAGVLQSYPVDFRWRGTRTAIFQQIGNAVPPLMARAVLEAAIS